MSLVLVQRRNCTTDVSNSRNRATVSQLKVGAKAALFYLTPQHLTVQRKPACVLLQPRAEGILCSPNISVTSWG